MSATVYLADLRAGSRENLFAKLVRLLDQAGITQIIRQDELTAVKIHFGEKGGHAYIRPVFIRCIVDQVKQLGGKPFLTDSCTLYPGERKEAVSAICCGIENGFAYAVAGAPLIMCDGLRGHSSRRVPVAGDLLETADIGGEILEADALITVSHFKCHELTGFGGALKNLGMGCSSREGKLEQHSTLAPEILEERCVGCGICLRACSHQAIALSQGKARLDSQRCVGCGRCISVCEVRAIVNFVTQVSPACDCYGHSDAAIVPDLGILASTDPVALDQACVDLVNQAQGLPDTALSSGHEPGGDKFRGVHPEIDWTITLAHAEKIGIGTRRYVLTRLQPQGPGW
ncbi:MAG: DUF362 domain-containing protein [Desulfuromonadaceae bacterium]